MLFKMNRIAPILLLLCFLMNCSTAQNSISNDLRKFEFFKMDDGSKWNYAYYLPKDFDPSKTYPVLIGPGEATPGSYRSFFWKKGKDTFGWILVEFAIFEGDGKGQVQALLKHLRKQFKVENNKFHVVGFSANSAPIFNLVLGLAEHFQSITGIPGHPRTSNKDELMKLTNTKVQFIVGQRDAYWLGAAKKSHQLLEELGIDSRLEIIPNGGHVLEELIGEGFLRRVSKLR